MTETRRQTHLEYYREHQIAPVRYDLSNLQAHLERRFSLYTKLGVPPLSVTKARILEVAAGTGHNSLYLSQLLPTELVLLEPNEVGVQHIRDTYQAFTLPHTAPTIISQTLEAFSPTQPFDMVFCENWLGISAHELTLLDKLAGMVATHGMLVLTTVSPIGFVPNLLRRFLSNVIAPFDKSFQQRTDLLTTAFASHLNTLVSMTRNHVDWVQDNMLNPAYFTLCLSMPMLVERLGSRFLVNGSLPSFVEDWRWFKGLHAARQQFNTHFLNEYWQKAHNFLDCREAIGTGDTHQNTQLESKATALLNAIATHENQSIAEHGTAADRQPVMTALDDFIEPVPTLFANTLAGLQEVRDLINNPVTLQSVQQMRAFSGLFGRETAYVSLIRMP